ncbi:hypothetical protein MSG28_015328 [Choristoneura fumiferana]|uniref:Uncharacterized protein n=1 Tax=Choristoneura fumiferana TaxID=7141 RepID=A0ACC0KAA1_CHOFU|nr:hypothetical protein MSG28_015328 [Choristoneura fumiferana]
MTPNPQPKDHKNSMSSDNCAHRVRRIMKRGCGLMLLEKALEGTAEESRHSVQQWSVEKSVENTSVASSTTSPKMNKRKIYTKADLLFKIRKLGKLVQYASESNSDSDDDETRAVCTSTPVTSSSSSLPEDKSNFQRHQPKSSVRLAVSILHSAGNECQPGSNSRLENVYFLLPGAPSPPQAAHIEAAILSCKHSLREAQIQ